MRTIEIRSSKKFKGAWVAFEQPGVEPAFQDRQHALSYAKGRFGGGAGEVHVYDDGGKNIIETIPIDDRIKYPNA